MELGKVTVGILKLLSTAFLDRLHPGSCLSDEDCSFSQEELNGFTSSRTKCANFGRLAMCVECVQDTDCNDNKWCDFKMGQCKEGPLPNEEQRLLPSGYRCAYNAWCQSGTCFKNWCK